MKLYNYEVESFAEFLLSLELGGKQSRMRTKLCKVLVDRIKEVDDDRLSLAKEFALKEKDGETPISEALDDGRTVFKIDDEEGFSREYNVLMREEFIIENTEDKKDMLETVKEAILNTNQVFSGQSALQYDRWCEIVED